MKAFLEGLSAPFKSCFGWIAIGLLFVLFSIMLSGCVSHRVYDIPQSRDSAEHIRPKRAASCCNNNITFAMTVGHVKVVFGSHFADTTDVLLKFRYNSPNKWVALFRKYSGQEYYLVSTSIGDHSVWLEDPGYGNYLTDYMEGYGISGIGTNIYWYDRFLHEELSSKFTATYTWPEWRINVIANSANHD